MDSYINRLIGCGYTIGKAHSICCDFIKNLSLLDLELFVECAERRYNVGIL